MYCIQCGKELQEAVNFCPACGRQLNNQAARPHSASTAKTAANTAGSFMELLNPLNGSKYSANVDQQTLLNLNSECKDDREYDVWIDNLDGINATLRDVFKKLVKHVVVAGKIIVKMGKVILNFIMKLVREFAHTIAGLAAGFILGLIFSSIPIIGWALGPLVLPLLMAVGGIAGFMEDMGHRMGNAGLAQRIQASVRNNIGALGLNF
ncbi:MAG: zinc ribbon domain-containing protein [Treponema sp.]|jgi:hypothetical protein|nr:zinc ribbon domain-containing protein [Treponema sp.]